MSTPNNINLPDNDNMDMSGNMNKILNKYKDKNIQNDKGSLADITNEIIKESKKTKLNELGVSDKTLNDMMNLVNESKTCGTKCQNKKKSDESKEVLLFALHILKGSPELFDVSFKNYYITKYGKNNYVNYITDNAKKNINNFINKRENDNSRIQDVIKNIIKNYTYNVDYLDNIDDIIKSSKDNLSDIDNKINKYIKKVNLDKRSNFFESNNIRNILNYTFYINIIYYFALIFAIIRNNFFSYFKKSSVFINNFNLYNILLVLLLLTLLFLPILIKKIIILFIRLYEKFLEILNIQKFPQTYNDIIMEDD